MGATSLSVNPVFDSRMKHITLAFHFVLEIVQKKTFRVAYVSINDQLVVLTKPLLRQMFESFWFMPLYSELGHAVFEPPVIYCDNIGATSLSVNPTFHSWMKHIAFAYHFVRENVQKKTFKVAYLDDVLTKPLLPSRFEFFVSKLNLSF
ncbi:hypothetical protein V2J09_018254 [Rumex salicifolius]